ncbi:uncharacterized protein LOC124162975 isoform X2 [Ischnura elegans]|uniref:uncharacterized protein LOC124162975 isoform X2 n=1 Tax=Ischnura elegans TaxID=197161 RepID=UPI001ED89F8A|nr:uncharacterized protein LOC124162975 isoform X2 [Ischnura elegans]
MSKGITEKLIEKVKGYPFIYQPQHEHYSSMRLKEETWAKIARELGYQNGDVLRKKWKNLRDSYAKHLRAEKTHTRQQAKGVVRYRAWPWALQMEFLRPILQVSPTDSNMSRQDMALDDIGEEDTSASEDRIPIKSPGDENDTFEEPIPPEPTDEQISSDTSARKPSNAQKRGSEETSPVSQVIQYLEKRRVHHKFKSCDEIDLVCMGYAQTIKKFKPRRQAMVKFKILELLMREELAQLEEEDGEHL